MENLKRKVEKQFDVVNSVTLLEAMLYEHNTEDELCGDHIVIPTEKISEFFKVFKTQVTAMLSTELNKSDLSIRPLRAAVSLMNKKKKWRYGNTNQFSPTDDN